MKDKKPVLATSNLIELKEGKKYLIILDRKSGLHPDDLKEIRKTLNEMEIQYLAIILDDAEGVKIVEA